MKVKVVFHREREGGFSAAVPAFPGCYSCGDTLSDARANIREAALCWLEAANDRRAFEEQDQSKDDVVEDLDLNGLMREPV
jgi:predicted RNase H-like HicB family nuclease